MARSNCVIRSVVALSTSLVLGACSASTSASTGARTGGATVGSAADATSSETASSRTHAATINDTLHPYQPGVDVQHYDFRIWLPERGKNIRGAAEITVSRDLRVDTLRLDLLSLEVHDVDVAGVRREIRRDSARLHIPLKPSDGATVQVLVSWEGEPTDGLIIREDTERGWSAFGDNWPNRGRHWLPLVDHPSDKATVSWTITAPTALALVANGVQQDKLTVSSQAGYSQTRFAMRQPIPPHLMVLGAARMNETSLGNTACGSGIDGACVPQSVWTFPQETSYAPGPFSRAGDMIEYFARTAGSYPYERLAHLQSATRFGGMGNATAIFYSDNAFRRRDVGLGLIAHETVHQWFGNAVTPRRWQDLWLSEGFASYWAPLYLRHAQGDSAQGDSVFREQMREMRETIIAAPIVAQRPVVDTVGAQTPLELLNANSYQKGGWVLHMMRQEVGDAVFFRSAREYQRIYRHGTATTNNFLQIVERNAGRSMTAFATQWLHRPGWAELDINAAPDESGRTIALEVTQGSKFEPFAVPLVLLLQDATGKEVRTRVEIKAERSQRITVNVQGIGRPVAITPDPDVTLLGSVQVHTRF